MDEYIKKVNASGASHVAGHNQFSDWLPSEFKAMRSSPISRPTVVTDYFTPTRTAPIPKGLDWREKGKVGPVSNQGQCGSDWAFAVTGALESAYAIKSGKLLDFSEQQLLDCV